MIDQIQRLYDEYMDVDSDDSVDASAYLAEMAPDIIAALKLAVRVLDDIERTAYNDHCPACGEWIYKHAEGCGSVALREMLKK